MGLEISQYRGCLLGLAVGDAMGLAVDKKSYEEICRDYGPNGLLGYDLTGGNAEVSSYTQIAAFSCNGLLLSVTRGRVEGNGIPYARYIAVAMDEWCQTQRYARFPNKMRCWVSHVEQLRRRKCLDARTLDVLSRGAMGSIASPASKLDTPGALTAAVPVGLFFYPERMEIPQVGLLGAQALALTHGDPATFLCGAVLAYVIAGIIQDRDVPLEDHFTNAAQAVGYQFGRKFPQANRLKELVERVVAKAAAPGEDPGAVMETLGCDTCERALLGAMYAALVCRGDFDRAMILAVNHSGRSAAVGAVTGAVLGAYLGEEALPDFYLESLEPASVLSTLAEDLVYACPREFAARLFDDDWDRKYVQGEP